MRMRRVIVRMGGVIVRMGGVIVRMRRVIVRMYFFSYPIFKLKSICFKSPTLIIVCSQLLFIDLKILGSFLIILICCSIFINFESVTKSHLLSSKISPYKFESKQH